ncbi:hypothetical protein MMC12_006249 [Toensbergia leucococca]|nr:hypothetical protein [Toensbergia leucococca]
MYYNTPEWFTVPTGQITANATTATVSFLTWCVRSMDHDDQIIACSARRRLVSDYYPLDEEVNKLCNPCYSFFIPPRSPNMPMGVFKPLSTILLTESLSNMVLIEPLTSMGLAGPVSITDRIEPLAAKDFPKLSCPHCIYLQKVLRNPHFEVGTRLMLVTEVDDAIRDLIVDGLTER